MSNCEHITIESETLLDRDYYRKRSELLMLATNYVERGRVWARDFHRDAAELGYSIEYTESLTLLSEVQRRDLTPRAAKQFQGHLDDRKVAEQQAWAAYAPWNQEERI